MRRFDILEPKSIDEACRILSQEEDVKLLAGGTALLILIKQGIFVPKTLINLKKINGAGAVTYDSKKGLRVGGLASIYDVESAPAVREHYPLLAQACHVVANIRIRNMATIGGNLAHADYQSDPPAALVALDASVELTNRNTVRNVKLADFLIGMYETGLARDELLTALLVRHRRQVERSLPEVYDPLIRGSAMRGRGCNRATLQRHLRKCAGRRRSGFARSGCHKWARSGRRQKVVF